MDQTGLKLESAVESVLAHIAENQNFLLSGGAGSGKTYSLVQVIGELLRTDPSAFIACITYTNAAVHEIESRVSNARLFVSTIHDFLWGTIRPYQTELKVTLIKLLSGDDPMIRPGSTLVSADMFAHKDIQYKEYMLLSEGIISHDEIIKLAAAMFENYPKLRDILRDRFRYILVDEYQDTAPQVVMILLDYLTQSTRKGVCGFFGDAMQSIYEDGVGDIQSYVATGAVAEVKKEQNRRNPRLVFELANKLRADGIVQHASKDLTAPNMRGGSVRDGHICFYYTMGGDSRLQDVKNHLGWDFSDVLETKELNLTHNLIAPQAGFGDLMAIYDRDGVLSFRDRIVAFIKKSDDLNNYDGLTFGETVALLQKGKSGPALNAVSPTAGMRSFIEERPDLMMNAEARNFREFRRMYVDKEQLVDDKKQSEDEIARKGSNRCDFIRHVFKIQKVVHLYQQRRYNEFLRHTEYRLARSDDKARLKERIEAICAMGDAPASEVIRFAHETGLCVNDDRYRNFTETKGYLYDRVKDVPFRSFKNLYDYLEGRTTFSTQHKIKGREFDRILVVMDSGGWNNYNFNYLFEGNGNPSVFARTQKLFYVCCTRAKEELAVYFHNPSPKALSQAEAWFGADNCVPM
ncbi:UvrD-helicase domain-containing protein [Novosphingobium sediminis]|uniref:UvrD-helicase domain-containing protein n=1 Tax=Novosphingobium sediminis TaxID=707214 RepID=UPI0011BF1231|nr:UvrD-helicase domain-containing protein [Novosphingobium sediminis]